MTKTEFYIQRPDGVNLYRTYSDENYYILQVDTGTVYSEAVDPEDSSHIYKETDELIEEEENKEEIDGY